MDDIDVDLTLDADSSEFLINTRQDRNDLDIIKIRANKLPPCKKGKYRDYDDENYNGDEDTYFGEFENIQKTHTHSDSKPTDVIKKCLLEFNLFSCGGAIHDAPSPGLYIDEIGYIGFPLVEEQIKRIISKSKMAPFGKREETILDENISHTWQMEPSQFTIKNSKWDSAIGSLVNHVCNKLRYHSKMIKYTLHKLLVYEPGSFFKPHRDTEKENGMLATLVVVLPSIYSGGQLVVRHCGREYEYDFSNTFETNFIAFCDDCEHEIKPIVSGYRICLIYNLVNKGTKIPPKFRDYKSILNDIIKASKDWTNNAYTCPTLLAYGLNNRYTNASLSFDSLKGSDIMIAQVIKKVSESVPLDITLVNMRRVLVDYTEEPKERTTILAYATETGEDWPFLKNGLIRRENMIQAQFWEDKNVDEEKENCTSGWPYSSRVFYHTGIIFSPKEIRCHKFLRQPGYRYPGIMKYLNTLEGRNHQEATSVFAWWLKNPPDPFDCFCNEDISDFFFILFQYGYEDPTIDFINFAMRKVYSCNDHLIELVRKLHKEFPTISTTLAFRELVSRTMGRIYPSNLKDLNPSILEVLREFRELLDVNIDE